MTKEINKKEEADNFIEIICGNCGKSQMSISYPKTISAKQAKKDWGIEGKDYDLDKKKITCTCECGNSFVIMI